MSAGDEFIIASEAARRLGISVKALRLYEQRGFIRPVRSAAGWRVYGPEQMARAAEVVALRALGLSLAAIARVLTGDAQGLEPALAAHQATLEGEMRALAGAVEKVRQLREGLANGRTPTMSELARLHPPANDIVVAFDLPWPWGGERFELSDVRPLTYIVGPLFSGKTKLALALARALPNAAFVGLQRLADGGAATRARLDGDAVLTSRVDRALTWLVDDGATKTDALIALLAALEDDGPEVLVVDMIEQGLDAASQRALIAHLRRRGASGRPLFMLTRSNAILDLGAVGPHEAIIFCPANHSAPTRVAAHPGAPGYEALASCLGPPHMRARTAGVIAWREPGGGAAAARS